MTEEVEVNVRQIDDQPTQSTTPLNEVVRRLLLAGVGAVALTRDEVESFVNRLVERGEIARKDGEKIVNEATEQLSQRPQVAKANINEQIENSLEQFLNRLNIPSKRDIDELSAKIAQLAARVEELRRAQAQTPPQDQTPGQTGV